ncbi:uncharacterized protein LOC122708690 [Cervus elaphus]|uniref:uncharacterized protein LOC122445811 n=1 Tax=Cervus canadensis TaxID=1574408 RepID=UPI001C9E1D21|nr:uncharacterized protein LOC122445811 [Cervus canadensis]XP_043331003.1 uncharacterized protein LOC122445811 [Cervus canadensis]XP_043780996.1 uncharacterized protein LOC122708690 [Cervus elaphus]XP_043780997.1 uncharacterized protein LOC122708690 [Cervus elaphus]
MGRDYLSVEVWDLNTQRRPVETHQARPWAPPPRPSCASMRSTSTFEASCVPSTMTASLTTPSAAGMAPTGPPRGTRRWRPPGRTAGPRPACSLAGCVRAGSGRARSEPAFQTRDQTSTPQRRGVRCNLSCQPSSSSAVSRPPPTRLRLPPARRPRRLCVRVSQAASLRCPGSKWVRKQRRQLATSTAHLAQERLTNIQYSGGSRFAQETRAVEMRV